MLISKCVFDCVVRSPGHFCVVDDTLVVETVDEDGPCLISTGFIDRIMCQTAGIVITKKE